MNDTEIEEYISELIKNQTQMNQARRREIEGDPIIYIVAVLIFYSSFILILMINYMKKVRTRNILVTQFRFLLRQKHYLFKEKNESEENRMYKAYIARWAKDEKDGPKTLNQRLESQNYTIYDKCPI